MCRRGAEDALFERIPSSTERYGQRHIRLWIDAIGWARRATQPSLIFGPCSAGRTRRSETFLADWATEQD